MTVTTRVAVVAFFLLLLGAVAAADLPTSPHGAECGTWFAPHWTDSRVQEVSDKAEGLQSDGSGIVYAAEATQRACDDALGTRRTVSLVLLVLAVLVPAGVLFIGRGRTEA